MKIYLFLISLILITGCSVKNDGPSPKNNIEKSISFFKEIDSKSKELKEKEDLEKITELNETFNRYFKYQKDKELYDINEYWASFYEMMQHNFQGDCEDFTFGKIQLAELFGIKKENIYVGYTNEGRHIFPIFFDGNEYHISDTNGKLRSLESYSKKYKDLKVYSFEDIWITKDVIFSKKRGTKTLIKITGISKK